MTADAADSNGRWRRPAVALALILAVLAISRVTGAVSTGDLATSLPADERSLGAVITTPFILGPSLTMLGLGVTFLLVRLTLLRRRLAATERQAAAAEQVFRDIAEASADWVWESDTELKIASLSGGFARSTGCSPASLIGQVWEDSPIVRLPQESRRSLKLALSSKKPFKDVRAALMLPDGDERHLRLSGRPFFDDQGAFGGYRGAGVDVSQLVAAEDQVKYLNAHDQLTGLPNRVVLTHRLEALLRQATYDGNHPILLAIDIDRFRSINEAYGVSSADHLIQQFAERLGSCLNAQDQLTRIGNDEFIILRERQTGLDPITATIARLQEALEKPFAIAGERVSISSRLGVYEAGAEDRDPEVCIKRVQIALTHSKRESSFVTTYSRGMDEEAEALRRLEEDLRAAIRERSMSIVYQPQMSLASGEVVSAEALMRWRHPSLGDIPPTRFIPLAESAGLITDLSLWAMRTAGADLRRVRNPKLKISVNVSALDFKRMDFAGAMTRTALELQVDPSRFELEVTESVLITDEAATLAMLKKLKESGFAIALDDFGTGYAGLGYLQMFPFDKLKIDQSFVRRVDRAEHARAIVRSVIKLAHDLGLIVVAEGVERREQLDVLRQEGCDLIQGYMLGRPVNAVHLEMLNSASEPA